MFTFATSTIVLVVALLAVAGIAAVTTVAAATGFFASNRKVRLARHESVRSYYGHLVLSH